MKRLLILLFFVSLGTATRVSSQRTPKRKIACKTPENARLCYWTHGRLRFGNGTPALRLWKIGTKRVLGIFSGPGSEKLDEGDNEHPELPPNLQKYNLFEGGVFGDFEVCPLEPEKNGHMQSACIESAKNIVREKL